MKRLKFRACHVRSVQELKWWTDQLLKDLPPRSSDFFPFGLLQKERRTQIGLPLNKLKRNMTTEINNLNVEVLHKVASNMVKHNRKTEQGRHVDHFYKKIHYCYKDCTQFIDVYSSWLNLQFRYPWLFYHSIVKLCLTVSGLLYTRCCWIMSVMSSMWCLPLSFTTSVWSVQSLPYVLRLKYLPRWIQRRRRRLSGENISVGENSIYYISYYSANLWLQIKIQNSENSNQNFLSFALTWWDVVR